MVVISGSIIADPVASIPNLVDYYPDNVSCVDRIVSSQGLKYGIAQFWQARPITLLSKAGAVVVQISQDLTPFRYINNSDWYHENMDFAIVDSPSNNQYGISRESIISKFGEPANTFSCPGIEILVYNRPTDILFMHQFVVHVD